MSINWDKYFHDICTTVASKSPCLSRKIGAIIVRDKSIISTGYNGPPRNIPHCGHERFIVDKELQSIVDNQLSLDNFINAHLVRSRFKSECPRKVLDYESGTHMELCPAQHAEENAISNAARLGTSTINSTLYLNYIIPCQKCFGTLINAGIVEIVCTKLKTYDNHTKFLLKNSSIKLREFEL